MATSDEELAHTATAPGSSTTKPAPELGATLGRYRLERMLGEGGMGVVHAAFDPDLERRVALKVLRTTDVGGDARQRLLREARAMARLTHENVVVVHEVGTAGDRDYVAMELIDGATLAEWLAEKPRSVFEITEAFIQAGRGLAAAHAASLVHRDFKPHNVLRRRDGKIVVTDFGLARGVENAQAIALDTTMKLGTSERSDLSGLTATGSVLGTPAYMAPEQWTGGIVGAAADQFGFCVALWEALTGARPYRGDSIEELKEEVRRGPAELDVSKLPRRLRKILVRGLDPDPARRFPSMNALLAALRRSERKVGIAFALIGAAVAAIVISLFAMHGRSSCDPPAIDPSKVWSEAFAKGVPPALSELFNAQVNHWAVARASACTAEPLVRPQQLHCLDGALQRIDLVRRVYATIPNPDEEIVAQNLVDPAVCLVPIPPRLGLKVTPDTIAAYSLASTHDDSQAHPEDAKNVVAAQALADKPGVDPCAKALAQFALEELGSDYQVKRAAMTDALATIDQCDDDRLRADLLIDAVHYAIELPIIGPRGVAAIKRADAAIQRVAEPTLGVRLDFVRGLVASQANNWKEALELSDHDIAVFENANQLRTAVRSVIEQIELRLNRSTSADYKAIDTLLKKWLPIAHALKGQDIDQKLALQLERDAAFVRYWTGDLVGGHADAVRLWKPVPNPSGVRVEGDVVDAKGTPVAGAAVAAGVFLMMDSIGYFPSTRYHMGDGNLRVATTDANGHFVIPDAAVRAVVVAQLGDRRSHPTKLVDHCKLVLAPTRTVSGKVTLGAQDHSVAVIAVRDPAAPSEQVLHLAPVAADGAFSIDGVTQDKVLMGVEIETNNSGHISSTAVPAGSDPVTHVVIDLATTGRKLDVIVRSTLSVALESAEILMLPGKYSFTNAGQFSAQTYPGLSTLYGKHPVGEAMPKSLAAKFHPGDLVASFSDVPTGEITVCAIGLMVDLQDRTALEKLQAHINELDMHCETLDGDAKTLVITAAPQKSFD